LNDSAFFMSRYIRRAGFWIPVRFLGLLHMEIVQERLEREFNLSLITTAPGVRYRITTQRVKLSNPQPLKAPGAGRDRQVRRADDQGDDSLTNDDYVGPILKLARKSASSSERFRILTRNRVSSPTSCL